LSKLTVEQRVQKAHVWLMGNADYCLYSGIIMLGKTEVNDTVPTACTDGLNTQYGRKFCDKLNDKELRGLILHENLHKAFSHLTTWRNLWDKNPRLANMACDYVINLMIHDSDREGKNVKLPEGGLLDEKFRGMDANTVYKLLEQNPPDEDEGGGGGGGGLDEHDWEGANGMTADEKEQLARDIDQGLRQGALLAGKMKGNVPREITDALTPKVDWREALREFVTSFCQERDEATWRRPSRRWIGQDVYMPSMIGESVGRLAVCIDMSGSIGTEQIGQFLGEVKAICETVRPEGIDLLYWDTQVCQHETYEQSQLDQLVASTKPMGGGGTDPQCIPDYLLDKKLKPECAVILTDGYVSSWGEGWPCPTLWGITTKNLVAGVGKSVSVV
jgi:predicted metal-dependent peptidase